MVQATARTNGSAPFLISGGGIGGLITAYALAHKGSKTVKEYLRRSRAAKRKRAERAAKERRRAREARREKRRRARSRAAERREKREDRR